MTPLFGKKSKKTSVPPQAEWSVFKGQHDGKEIILRLNTGNIDNSIKFDYPYQVGLTVPLKIPTDDGILSPEENRELEEIENIIDNSFSRNERAFCVAAITTANKKEFVYYANDPVFINKTFDIIRLDVSSHQLQLIVQLDQEWSVYQHFTALAGL